MKPVRATKAMAVLFNKPVVCPVLIGRTSEMAALHLFIDQVKSRTGGVALLCGEAGIGKSRLVAEVKTYATTQDFLLLQGNCFPTDISCPYAPLLDLLRSTFVDSSTANIAAAVGPSARALFPLLLDLIPQPLDLATLPSLEPELEKRRLFAALAQFFINQAAKQPVLLIVEDLQWSDDTSLEFLHYLGRRCITQPLLLLLTYRSDEVRPALSHWLAQVDREHLAQEVSIARLERNDVDTMLHAIFDPHRSVQLELLDTIYALTEGNPFFIEEVLKSLITVGDIFYTNGVWCHKPSGELRVPRSVQDAVQQRIDQLSESAKRLVLLAAVAGRRFDFSLLQQLTEHSEQQLLLLVKELIAAQLIVEESTEQFAFRHALTRQAIYAQLLARERMALHSAIAEAMERLYISTLDPHLADLAYHFYEAEAWANALDYGQRAGEQAQALHSPRAAIEHFTRALEATRQLAVTAPPQLYHARGQAYETLGKFEDARGDYEWALDAAREAHDVLVEWQSLIDLGLLWTGRDYEQAGVLFRRALDLAQTLADPQVHARSLNRMGNWYLNAEQPLEALRYHQKALSIFQALHDQHGTAETLDLLGMASYVGSDLVQCVAYYKQAVELLRALDNRQGVVTGLVAMLLCGGSYRTDTLVCVAMSLTEVMHEGEAALKIAREIGQRPGEAFVLIFWGLSLGWRGDYLHALEVVQQGLEIAREIEHRQWMTAAHCVLGALYLDLLELSMACQHLKQALTLAHEIGSQHWISGSAAFLASASILSNDLAEAEAVLTPVLDADAPAQTIGQRLVWCARAELALAKRKPDRALAITDHLIASAANISAERNILRVSKLRGEALVALHQHTEAEIALQTAREIALAQGAGSMQWRISVALGKLYQALHRHEEAELAFSTAQTTIEELATSIPDASLREHFLSSATALIPRTRPLSLLRATKQTISGLTPREREVAALIGQGKTNREIANRLVVSERTIETHVRNVLTKLDFTSRTQLAAWAVKKGLVDDE
jgi:DNA-binding CsgD family transcriptional regulator/tetratricopeptide (TPR) repeat protein